MSDKTIEKAEKVKSAQEMSRDQREISVSEFFEKNRHLLGYDNKVKALLTVVREAVDNSLDACETARIVPDIKVSVKPVNDVKDRYVILVEDNGPGIVKQNIGRVFGKLLFGSKFHKLIQSLTGDEPVFVIRNGKTEIIPIGNLVNSYLQPEETEKNVLDHDLLVPAFDRETYKYRFARVSHVIRHKRENEIVKLTLNTGRTLKVTGCHSIFSINPATGGLEETEARNLKIGDYIAIPKKLPSLEISEINLLDYLSYEHIKDNWAYVYGINGGIFEKLIEGAEAVHKKTDKSRKYYRLFTGNKEPVDILDDSMKQYMNKNFLPIQLVLKLGLKDAVKGGFIKTYCRGKETRIPVSLEMTDKLARFLGLFVAEGHSDKRQIALTFGRHEDHLIDEVLNFARIFGLNTTLEHRKNSIRIKLFGNMFVKFVSDVCGVGAHNKKVPEFVFRAGHIMRQHFLDAIYQGDGHKVKGRNNIMLNTVSKRLANEIMYLWSMQGIAACITSRTNKNGLGRFPSTCYVVNVYGNDINKSFVYSCPNTERTARQIEYESVKQISINSNQLVKSKLIESDILMVKIRNIETINEGHDLVYDLSVTKSENFVGGFGGIACHNSRGQQGIGISGAVLYSQLTSGKPSKIVTSTGDGKTHYMDLMIDTFKNEPEILKEEIKEGKSWHGVKVEMEVEGKYVEHQQSISEYLKQTAMSNPYAEIIYDSPNGKIKFERSVKTLPEEPKSIKPHPHGVEIGILRRMLKTTEARTLTGFFTSDFSRVGQSSAKEIIRLAKLGDDVGPKNIDGPQVEKLFQAIQQVQLIKPQLDCLSPLGEKLIEEGLKKQLKPEYVVAITRPPDVYRGNPFQIECCTGDTKIILENGSVVDIKNYIENGMFKKYDKVLSMTKDLKIKPQKVHAVQKFKNVHKILKIETRTGRVLKLTQNNELPTIINGEIIWKAAGELGAGDFVATPRRLAVDGRKPHILELMDEDCVKVHDIEAVRYLMSKCASKFYGIKNVAKNLGIDYNTLKSYNRKNSSVGRPTLSTLRKLCELSGSDYPGTMKSVKEISYADNGFPNPVKITVPDVCEDLLYVLGLLNSDGYISKREIVFTNIDPTLHEAFAQKTEKLFGIKVKSYRPFTSSFSNKTVYNVLRVLEDHLPELDDSLIVSWLKGVADGDGWVACRKGKIRSIGIATAKRNEAEFVQTMLLRLGIQSKIERQLPSNTVGKTGDRIIKTLKPKDNIVIYDFWNVAKFASLVGFRQQKMARRLAESIVNTIDCKQQHDVLDVGVLLKRLRQENGLFQHSLCFSDQTIRQAEKSNRMLTRNNLQSLLTSKQLKGDAYGALKLLAFSDILWDRIIGITEVPHEEYVYDLTMESDNFVADNIVMHNCGIAYGGELPAESVATLYRFANRVPLMYQAGDCALAKAVSEIEWRRYGLEQGSGASLPTGPVVIFIHIASVWVPFTSESKEAIASYPEIIKEVKLALQDAGRKMSIYVNKKRRAGEAAMRISLFEKYIPEVSDALARLSGADKHKIASKLENMLKKGKIVIEDTGEQEEDKKTAKEEDE
ncbi:MAG: DNA topoisomerase VI subunit B [Candidatus Aenigmarchaeota archaeon]|nr:DNA topoisomerase VI subunit B [Candidatus Aenigmarchaeota archaeon]